MPPLTSKTITRLDPALPLLWRDGETLQFGVDGDVRVRVDAPWVELLLARMANGFRRVSFDVIAHGAGAPHRQARALLARVEPLLVDEEISYRAAWVESIDHVDGRDEYRMREALADEGVSLGRRESREDVGVILVQGAAAALQFARYLREDTTHLPVAFERGRTTVGPLVVPGRSACLACRDGHERDRDPAWPRLHTQLIGRGAGPISAARVAEAATLAARLLSDAAEVGTYAEVSATRGRSWRSVSFHEDCRCRVPSSRSPRGTSTAPVRLDQPSETRTATAFARPA